MTFDLVAYLKRQEVFSDKTFGPGELTDGILDHIREELKEIEEDPDDIYEWVDLLILAFDGARRRGFTAEQIAASINLKQNINERRDWPDWRTHPPDKAFHHIG